LPKRQQSLQQIGKYKHTPLPLPRCNLCGFFSKTASTPRHIRDLPNAGNLLRKDIRHFFLKRQEMARKVSFNVNGEKIDKASEFKYLGRILEETDDDEHAANRQLTRALEQDGVALQKS
jgi:hypothetical protein